MNKTGIVGGIVLGVLVVVWAVRVTNQQIGSASFDQLHLTAVPDGEYIGKSAPANFNVYKVAVKVKNHGIVGIKAIGGHDKTNVAKVADDLFSAVVTEQTLNISRIPEPASVSKCLLIAVDDALMKVPPGRKPWREVTSAVQPKP